METCILQTVCFKGICKGADCPLLLCPHLRDQIIALMNRIESQGVENIRLQSHLDILNGGGNERGRRTAQGTL